MFDIDAWQEILETVRKNKLRTLLTAFSVAWGILMLVVLLGSGQGLVHGVEYGFRDDATNSHLGAQRADEPALPRAPPGALRAVHQRGSTTTIKDSMARVDHITSRFFIRGNLTVAYRGETSSYNVRCVHPDHQFIEQTIVTEGRFINPLDIAECRKVAVIGDRVKAQLFKGRPAHRRVHPVNSVPFRVVGVFTDEGSEGEMETIYLPISTAQRAFSGANRVAMIMMTVGDAGVEESQAIAADLRQRSPSAMTSIPRTSARCSSPTRSRSSSASST